MFLKTSFPSLPSLSSAFLKSLLFSVESNSHDFQISHSIPWTPHHELHCSGPSGFVTQQAYPPAVRFYWDHITPPWPYSYIHTSILDAGHQSQQQQYKCLEKLYDSRNPRHINIVFKFYFDVVLCNSSLYCPDVNFHLADTIPDTDRDLNDHGFSIYRDQPIQSSTVCDVQQDNVAAEPAIEPAGWQ
jgi:hypothetical protein